MLIGHYSTALAAKALCPRLSLAWLFLASQAVDILWVPLVLVGLESFRIDPSLPSNHLDLTRVAFTHSLPAILLWSGLAYAVARRRLGERRAAVIVAAVVGSHWVLDLLVHRPDLSIGFGGAPKVGLGLWNHPLLAGLLEGGLVAAAGVWYLLGHRPPLASRRRTLGLVGALLLLNLVAYVGPSPSSVTATVLSVLGVFLGLAWVAGRVERVPAA